MSTWKTVHTVGVETLSAPRKSVSWSENNQIAVVTTSGIKLFRLIAQPYHGIESKLHVEETLLQSRDSTPEHPIEAFADMGILLKDVNDPSILAYLTMDRSACPDMFAGDLTIGKLKIISL
jgi:hypothetical protein